MAEIKVALIVAHPDDETLWAGGALLMNPGWKSFIITLCRATDPDRAPRFRSALAWLNAQGRMGDLDDGPAQDPLPPGAAEDLIVELLPRAAFDLVITHSPRGEYTRHLRHEETARAVVALWTSGRLRTPELRMFAYQDAARSRLPEAIGSADMYTPLPALVWEKKYTIITRIYGFAPDSWEARSVPRTEAFWQFTAASSAGRWEDKIPQ
jgi:LmbE family N-acetylglucosaminyl deacetylase